MSVGQVQHNEPIHEISLMCPLPQVTIGLAARKKKEKKKEGGSERFYWFVVTVNK